MSASVLATFGLLLIASTPRPAVAEEPRNRIQRLELDVELGRTARDPGRPRISGGAMHELLRASGALERRANAAKGGQGLRLSISTSGTQGCPNLFLDLRAGHVDTRVNQDCSLRGQFEVAIAANPTNASNLAAGMNDARTGSERCAFAWSFDGGATWGDQVAPFYEFEMADGANAEVCSDPTVTFDASGNAYVGGLLGRRSSPASALVVAKSNSGIGGAFYHSPVQQPFQLYRTTPLGVVTSDDDVNILNDNALIVADASSTSPKKNNLYAAWTRFNAAAGPAGNGLDDPIFFSQSVDGGATWSLPIAISGANPAVCTGGSALADPSACDQDQGAHPVVGRDGTLYVAFGNFNTTTLGVNQHLMVRCPAGSDCSQPGSWTAPSKISDDFALQPFAQPQPDGSGDPGTGCPAGAQCLPPNGYRLDDSLTGSLSVGPNDVLFFVWADLRNGDPALCVFGTAHPVCDNDVFYAYSNDRGASWSAPVNVTPKARFGATAQWMPWSAISPDGNTLWIMYYDRSYGTCEATGCNNITLAAVSRPATPIPLVKYERATTSSMPNLVSDNNPLQAGFLGDHPSLAIDARGRPNLVWVDTRGLHGTVEEDIYFTRHAER